ncbi:hypothetical protein [Methanosarcina lacustris]|uniref:hypothetical protein n=1 Tax=Methanosarcina lacustris TaxID=170861 RepID=UPI000A7FBFE8|nr:hypothetical protein [Methanosarcina lacustris]
MTKVKSILHYLFVKALKLRSLAGCDRMKGSLLRPGKLGVVEKAILMKPENRELFRG